MLESVLITGATGYVGRRLHERRFRTIRHAVEFVRQQTERKADGGYARSIKI